jgi:hypothetical protein
MRRVDGQSCFCTASVECGLSGSDVPMGNQSFSAPTGRGSARRNDMLETPAADVGMASLCNFPAS